MTASTDRPPVWTLTYDAEGDPGTGQVEALIKNIDTAGVRDLIVFSHGWNNGQAQATSLYERWFALLRPQLADPGTVGFVGLFWPSQLWRDEPIPDFAPARATGGGAAALTTTASAGPQSVSLDPDVLADLKDLFPDRATELDEIAALLQTPPTPETLGRLFAAISAFSVCDNPVDDGANDEPAAVPGAFDAGNAPAEVFTELADQLIETGVEFGDAGTGAAGLGDWGTKILGGAKELLRQASYRRMKERAGVVGAKGLGPTISVVGERFPELRIHLVGHSFGGRLVSYALSGLAGGAESPVKSVTLLQAAFSRFAFADTLPFRNGAGALAGRLRNVDGPMFVCYSRHDKALGTFYPLASMLGGDDAAAAQDRFARWRAMGSHGAFGVDPQHVGAVGTVYRSAPGAMTNLDAGQYVIEGDSPSGAHSDIFKPELAWVVASAVRLGSAAPSQ